MAVGNLVIGGSCNWTTASRANLEVDFFMRFGKKGLAEFHYMFDHWWELAEEFRDAQGSREQRRASKSPSRQRGR